MSEKKEVILLPEELTKHIHRARYRHENHPEEMIKYMIDQDDYYINNWLRTRKNMERLLDACYNPEVNIEATLNFNTFENVLEKFMRGYAFGVWVEEAKTPLKILMYDKTRNEIFELKPGSLGGIKLDGLGDMPYAMYDTELTPFHYAKEKDFHFYAHYIREVK